MSIPFRKLGSIFADTPFSPPLLRLIVPPLCAAFRILILKERKTSNVWLAKISIGDLIFTAAAPAYVEAFSTRPVHS